MFCCCRTNNMILQYYRILRLLQCSSRCNHVRLQHRSQSERVHAIRSNTLLQCQISSFFFGNFLLNSAHTETELKHAVWTTVRRCCRRQNTENQLNVFLLHRKLSIYSAHIYASVCVHNSIFSQKEIAGFAVQLIMMMLVIILGHCHSYVTYTYDFFLLFLFVCVLCSFSFLFTICINSLYLYLQTQTRKDSSPA